MIAAGGTGGHVFPAISIADALRELQPDAAISFVGTREKMEWVAVPKAGYDIHSIWVSGFHRTLTLKNLLFPIKLLVSIYQSWKLLKALQPDMLISCGGFVAGPVGWVAAKMNIPIVIQEQNSFPGVTNRMLSKDALIIFTAFEQAQNWLPTGKVKLLGNPTRKSLLQAQKAEALRHFGLSEERKTLLILGGSGGALSINEAMVKHVQTLHDAGLNIIWQCGPRYYEQLIQRVPLGSLPHLRLKDFVEHMPNAYAVADMVVSRAGASSCAELLLTGKPSVLVPSPHVAGDHQLHNAMSMVEEGAAVLVKDHELDSLLASTVTTLLKDEKKLHQMSETARSLARPDAAKHIAKEILNLLEHRN